MPTPEEATFSDIAIADIARRVVGLGKGERLTLIGVERRDVADALRGDPGGIRGALLLESDNGCGPELILSRLLDDLADLALDCWPQWYGRDDPAPEHLIAHATSHRAVSAPWLRAAARRVTAGHPPRFRRTAKVFEFAQLMRAIDPREPVLIAAIDPVASARAAPMIQVLEWCAGQGASVVAVFPARPPLLAPYDRLLYGALDVVRGHEPASARFIPARSKAHHASAVEQRVEAALRRDTELAPLFVCNEVVPLRGYGLQPRVDLLWREGRVVVELDGPEHQLDPKFAGDRHRDYELLVAGYFVLRITNDQVVTDLPRAIEKIRAVVRFRRSTERGI